MNAEQFTNQITSRTLSAIDHLASKSDQAIATVSEKMNMLFEELVRWRIGSNILWIFIGLIFLIVVWRYYKFFLEKKTQMDKDYQNGLPDRCWAFLVFSCIGMIGMGIAGFSVICYHIYDLIYLYCAPHLYVIEYVAQILGNK